MSNRSGSKVTGCEPNDRFNFQKG